MTAAVSRRLLFLRRRACLPGGDPALGRTRDEVLRLARLQGKGACLVVPEVGICAAVRTSRPRPCSSIPKRGAPRPAAPCANPGKARPAGRTFIYEIRERRRTRRRRRPWSAGRRIAGWRLQRSWPVGAAGASTSTAVLLLPYPPLSADEAGHALPRRAATWRSPPGAQGGLRALLRGGRGERRIVWAFPPSRAVGPRSSSPSASTTHVARPVSRWSRSGAALGPRAPSSRARARSGGTDANTGPRPTPSLPCPRWGWLSLARLDRGHALGTHRVHGDERAAGPAADPGHPGRGDASEPSAGSGRAPRGRGCSPPATFLPRSTAMASRLMAALVVALRGSDAGRVADPRSPALAAAPRGHGACPVALWLGLDPSSPTRSGAGELLAAFVNRDEGLRGPWRVWPLLPARRS